MHPTRTPGSRTTALALSSLALAFTLTGCGLQFVPDQSQSKPAAEQQSPSADSPTTKKPSAEAAGDAPGTGVAAKLREEYEGTAQRVVSCPDGSLEISDVGGVLQLDSDCSELVVSGSGAVVLAENVDALHASGVGLTIFVKDLGSAEVTGTGNTVVWESGTAVINNSGTGNTLLPAN